MKLESEEQFLEKLRKGEKLTNAEKHRFKAILISKFRPEEDKDFYINCIKQYTVELNVIISMEVNDNNELDKSDIILKAISGIRNRDKDILDVDGDLVRTETIKTYKVDCNDIPFDEKAWQEAKIIEYLENKIPQRPWEKPRPINEKKIGDFFNYEIKNHKIPQ